MSKRIVDGPSELFEGEEHKFDIEARMDEKPGNGYYMTQQSYKIQKIDSLDDSNLRLTMIDDEGTERVAKYDPTTREGYFRD